MTFAFIFESVGIGEWIVLLAVLLVVVGPKNLPSTARKFGQYYSKVRRAADGFKRQLMEMDTEFNNVVQEAEKAVENEIKETDPDLTSPDPSEYGGIEDYADYGGYDPAGTEPAGGETPTASAPEAVPSPEPQPASQPKAKPDLAGIKISVSPAPKTGDAA